MHCLDLREVLSSSVTSFLRFLDLGGDCEEDSAQGSLAPGSGVVTVAGDEWSGVSLFLLRFFVPVTSSVSATGATKGGSGIATEDFSLLFFLALWLGECSSSSQSPCSFRLFFFSLPSGLSDAVSDSASVTSS